MGKDDSRLPRIYRISFESIEKKYGIGAEELVSRGTLNQKDIDLLERGNVKALRISTINAICAETGCDPGELFIASQPPTPVG